MAVIYGATAICLGIVLEVLYGGEPITHHLTLVYAATIGSVPFVIACIISCLRTRIGLLFGLIAVALSWPYFVLELTAVPWGNLLWFVQFRTANLLAMVFLIISTLYSLNRLRRILASDL